ncbi:STAS domain-containing protein [Acrocarpospora sp. B8E8]|uniref:STAS domain-containing protein n=1 Tax=Acrocarpospora sp. B8E8 TaxID=3153572 RepID=UPI00325CD843
MPELEFSSRQEGAIVIISIGGELDAQLEVALHDRIEATVRQAAGSTDGKFSVRLILDLSGVTFLDSSAIRVIINALIGPNRPTKWAVIGGMSGRVERSMGLLGLTDRLPIFATAAQAMDAARLES